MCPQIYFSYNFIFNFIEIFRNKICLIRIVEFNTPQTTYPHCNGILRTSSVTFQKFWTKNWSRGSALSVFNDLSGMDSWEDTKLRWTTSIWTEFREKIKSTEKTNFTYAKNATRSFRATKSEWGTIDGVRRTPAQKKQGTHSNLPSPNFNTNAEIMK